MIKQNKEQKKGFYLEDIYLALAYTGEPEKSEIRVIMYPYKNDGKLAKKPYLLLKCNVEHSESKSNLVWLLEKAIKDEIKDFEERESNAVKYKYEIISKTIK